MNVVSNSTSHIQKRKLIELVDLHQGEQIFHKDEKISVTDAIKESLDREKPKTLEQKAKSWAESLGIIPLSPKRSLAATLKRSRSDRRSDRVTQSNNVHRNNELNKCGNIRRSQSVHLIVHKAHSQWDRTPSLNPLCRDRISDNATKEEELPVDLKNSNTTGKPDQEERNHSSLAESRPKLSKPGKCDDVAICIGTLTSESPGTDKDGIPPSDDMVTSECPVTGNGQSDICPQMDHVQYRDPQSSCQREGDAIPLSKPVVTDLSPSEEFDRGQNSSLSEQGCESEMKGEGEAIETGAMKSSDKSQIITPEDGVEVAQNAQDYMHSQYEQKLQKELSDMKIIHQNEIKKYEERIKQLEDQINKTKDKCQEKGSSEAPAEEDPPSVITVPPPPLPAPPPPPPPALPSCRNNASKCLPTKCVIRPRIKMRPLFWDRILLNPLSATQATLWRQLEESDIDVSEFER